MNKKSVKSDLGLLVQASLAVFLIIITFGYFFEKSLLPLLQILMALFMFVLAYNNQIIYHRKVMTYIYVLCGITILGAVFFG